MANLSYDIELNTNKTLEDELRKSILENNMKSLKNLF